MSGSRWVITPSWLSESLKSFSYSSPVYSCHLFLISSASVRSTVSVLYCAHLCLKYFLDISNFLEEIFAATAKSLQSCPTLCDPIDGSPPGSAVPRTLQARTLEWVAISFSNAWKWKVKVKPLSRARLLATPLTAAYQAPSSMGFSGQEYWSGLPLPSLVLYNRSLLLIVIYCSVGLEIVLPGKVSQTDPLDYSPPSSSVHGFFQARALEWGAIAFSVINC